MQAVAEFAPLACVRVACAALAVSRASYYRWRRPSSPTPTKRRKPPRALTEVERVDVLEVLHGTRFIDAAPRQVWATLLDEGTYLCSPRTMYRVLADHGEVRERRAQARHPQYQKPELLATAPNEVWSWDITKLMGPEKWTYFSLYVILDIFSRYVVGWLLATGESAALAQQLIETTVDQEGVDRDQLTMHADRGSAMTSKPVALLLADLGVTKTHSRPHVSNDNPYSEAQFKTLKYRPEFPPRFGSIQDARAHCRIFFHWYNHQHRHSGIGFMTPATVHRGRQHAVAQVRQLALDAAAARHPERFVRGPPRPPSLPTAAWINPPSPQQETAMAAH
jgi:putative transposase